MIKLKNMKMKVEMKIALSRKLIRDKAYLHDKLTLCLTLRKNKMIMKLTFNINKLIQKDVEYLIIK